MLDTRIFFRATAFAWVQANILKREACLRVMADMVRHNIVTEVMVANTGHIGASLSGTDALVALYHGGIMRVDPADPRKLDRDVFVMSKGHASPLHFAILASRGFFSDEALLRFRRLDGLQGHSDMAAPGVDANTGSLAMGISKAKGYAYAFRRRRVPRVAYVMVGDGELQEGQNWEALASAPAMKLGNVVMLIDQNFVQTDKLVSDVIPMPPVEEKVRAFGWEVLVVEQGNDPVAVRDVLSRLDTGNAVPKAVILKTTKGAGVSFMEHPAALAKDGMYHWHNKVPNHEQYEQATVELHTKIEAGLEGVAIPTDFWPILPDEFPRVVTPWVDDFVVRGYTKALLELTASHPELVALDGDLAIDCGIRELEEKKPDHFLEVGIAEQDMVSMAGSMAHQGVLPIVNTFSAFLSSRANEQMFNAQSEHGKVMYVGHLSGLVPATPGKSHQAVRDIGLVRTVPEVTICEPCCEAEAELMTRYLVEQHPRSSYLRLANCKGLREIQLPNGYEVSLGRGWIVREGRGIALLTAGPIMLAQALDAADVLAKEGREVRVINLPWHTDIDTAWLSETLQEIERLFVVNNHVQAGAQSEELRRIMQASDTCKGIQLHALSVEGFADTGQPMEVLQRFGLDGASIAQKIRER